MNGQWLYATQPAADEVHTCISDIQDIMWLLLHVDYTVPYACMPSHRNPFLLHTMSFYPPWFCSVFIPSNMSSKPLLKVQLWGQLGGSVG